MENTPFHSTFMLPQFVLGILENICDLLITRSDLDAFPSKLVGKVLEIRLKFPSQAFFIIFSHKRADWLYHYEGPVDCCILLDANGLIALANKKQQLSDLINRQDIVLTGDIQVAQQIGLLFEQLEKDPAEWLSSLVGDVMAQMLCNQIKSLIQLLSTQFAHDKRYWIDVFIQEKSLFAHRLEVADFCDQVAELEDAVEDLSNRLAQIYLNSIH